MGALPRYLLLQIRNQDDPMRTHEIRCFTRALACEHSQIEVSDLLNEQPSSAQLARNDLVLIGGSGRYSAAGNGVWLDGALVALRNLYEIKKPTFGSCWGFQALSRALGGDVQNDSSAAELGTQPVTLTDAGRDDPVFGPLGDSFLAPMGHEDSVIVLPSSAISLATTERCPHQAFCFPDRPMYATQFHPELTKDDLLERIRTYPEYIELISGMTFEKFVESCREMRESRSILARFAQHVLQ